VFTKRSQTNAAVSSRMECSNSDPFLDKHSFYFSRRRRHVISAHVPMLFLPYYAHKQEQPEYEKPQPGSFRYSIDVIYSESPYLGGCATRVWTGRCGESELGCSHDSS
jgi:hypothetical protein